MLREMVHQHQMHENRAERISDLGNQGTAMCQRRLMLLAFFVLSIPESETHALAKA